MRFWSEGDAIGVVDVIADFAAVFWRIISREDFVGVETAGVATCFARN